MLNEQLIEDDRLKDPGKATRVAATSLTFMSMVRWQAVQLW